MSKRRGHGEGSIYRRRDGAWVASLDLGHVNGKRKRKVVYGHTRKEAAEKLRQLQQQLDAGLNLTTEKQTVAAFLQTWLNTVVKPPHHAPTTHQAYTYIVNAYLIPHLGHIQLDRLAPQHVQAMMNDLSAHLSSSSVAYARTILVTALNQAVRWGYIARNVGQLTDPPRVERRERQTLTEEQAGQFLAQVAGHRLEVLYHVAFGLALRKGEIIALKWSDIDIEQGRLTVQKGKTPAARRTLSLPPTLIERLREHWQHQQRERLARGLEWQEHGLVFPDKNGKPLAPFALWRHFKSMLKKADLPDISFHDLRHSAASFLAASGEHPRTVMEILGHSKIDVTMEIYTHISNQQQRDALSRLYDRLQSGYKSESNETA